MNKITLLFMFFGLILMAQPGPNDGASFNGIDQFILMPDSDNINTTPVDNRTIETYFKVDNGINRQVFYKEGAEVNTIKFYVENGNLIVGSYRNDGGNNKSIWFRTPVSDDTWYHVALVLDNASELRFYLNGVLQATNSNFFQVPVHPGNFEIGRTEGPARYPNCATWGTNNLVEECLGDVTNTDNIELFFAGRVWGFRIWDDVRTEQEINDNKDILISDPNQPSGEGLLAFLINNTMSYQDDDGDFDTEDVQGDVLSTNELTVVDFKVFDNGQSIEVSSQGNIVPDQLILYDLLGKTVNESSNSKELSKGALKSGVYILRIVSNNRISNKKILIQY